MQSERPGEKNDRVSGTRQTPRILRAKGPLVSEREEVPKALIKKVRDINRRLRSARSNKECKEIERELLHKVVPQAPGDTYDQKLNALLFATWPLGMEGQEPYDEHMYDHELAYKNLISAILAMQRLGYDIIKGRVLEMSSGTGTLIKNICDIFPPDIVRDIHFLANDISPEMQRESLKKFEDMKVQPDAIEFMSHDLREIDLPEEFCDTTMMGSTLHLLTDPEVRKTELTHDIVDSHEAIKRRILEKGGINPLGWGDFHIMIDEWQARLSRSFGVVSLLFNAMFRPVPHQDNFRQMMGSIRPARLFAELKAKIDNVHSMRAFVYYKDPERMPGESAKSRFPQNMRTEYAEAEENIIGLCTAVDPMFIESFTKPGGVEFIPLSETTFQRATPSVEFSEKYDGILVSRQFHEGAFRNMSDQEREAMIEHLTDALNVGGTLMITDLFPHPRHPDPFDKSRLRTLMRKFSSRLLFQNTFRMPLKEGQYHGVHSFSFRKISD